ncbi:MAG: hypothetical protein JSR59_03150 [Proteobacteria bacterium]|nr:hypothetical protein [Pseudomonadota bacterium]
MNLATLTPADAASAAIANAHDRIGYELGWDYAHHGLALPAPYAAEPSSLGSGLAAGQAAFGARTLAATPHVRRWLQLRLHAWLRGRSVETFQVTPHYLRQIDATHCPITRAALGDGTGGDAASIDRVRNDAGYAAGNLVVMSRRANHAKAANGHAAAWAIAHGDLPDAAGLGPAAWRRIALLCSFVEPLSHAQACALPLHLLPPNRLRLFNPAQALQAMLSRQLLQPGWSRRIACFEELLPGSVAQRDFRHFFFGLLPRVLEGARLGDTLQARWAIEDAWASERVQQLWIAFAEPLGVARIETLLAQAARHGLATIGLEAMTASRATDGWDLETRGYIAPSATAASAQAAFAF